MRDPVRHPKTQAIRKKISDSLTGHAKTGEVALKSIIMALGSTLFAAPYFYHLLYLSTMPANLVSNMGVYGFLFMELFLLFILSLLCAMVGFSFSGRLGFPGFGYWSAFVKDLARLSLLGLFLIFLSIFFFDRHFYEISPSSYPRSLFYLATFPFKGAFTDEIILRLGLVTIGAGLFKSRTAGVVFGAVLALLFSIKYFQFVGINLRMTDIVLPYIFITFLVNLLLGYLYVTRGLLYAMGMDFLLKLKYAVIALVI